MLIWLMNVQNAYSSNWLYYSVSLNLLNVGDDFSIDIYDDPHVGYDWMSAILYKYIFVYYWNIMDYIYT